MIIIPHLVSLPVTPVHRCLQMYQRNRQYQQDEPQKFQFTMRKKQCMIRVMKHWKMLSRLVVLSPSLKISKTHLNKILSNQICPGSQSELSTTLEQMISGSFCPLDFFFLIGCLSSCLLIWQLSTLKCSYFELLAMKLLKVFTKLNKNQQTLMRDRDVEYTLEDKII